MTFHYYIAAGLRFGFGLCLLCGAVFAGEIPKGYRGLYTADGGVQVELRESKAVVNLRGKTVTLDVERENYLKLFDRLSKQKSALYIEEPPKGETMLRAFGVIFSVGGTQKTDDSSFARAEVFYLEMQREQPNVVPSLNLVWSPDGMVSLDLTGKRWVIGWGAQADYLTFARQR